MTKHQSRNFTLVVVNAVSILLLLLVLAGCKNLQITNPITDPKPLLMETDLQYGPPEYRQGYADGCKSALSAYGNSYQKTIYGLKKTPQYQDSQMYNQVWKDAWNYCYMWMFVYYRQDELL